MPILERFSYKNPKYVALEVPSKAVSAELLNGNRFLDQVQEYVYIYHGLKFFSEVIHHQAHQYLSWLDDFGSILHEKHLEQFYPTTVEMDSEAELKGVESVFNVIFNVIDNVQEALESFHDATATASLMPMALKLEEIMMKNSHAQTIFLEMAKMYENRTSDTSFDSWCKELAEEVNG